MTKHTLEELVKKPIVIEVYKEDSDDYISIKCKKDDISKIEGIDIRELVDYVLDNHKVDALTEETEEEIRRILQANEVSYRVFGELVGSGEAINNPEYIKPKTEGKFLECKIRVYGEEVQPNEQTNDEDWCYTITTTSRVQKIKEKKLKIKAIYKGEVNPSQIIIEDTNNERKYYHLVDEIERSATGGVVTQTHKTTFVLAPGDYKIIINNDKFKTYTGMISVRKKSKDINLEIKMNKGKKGK